MTSRASGRAGPSGAASSDMSEAILALNSAIRLPVNVISW